MIKIQPGINSEIDKLQAVILHTPGSLPARLKDIQTEILFNYLIEGMPKGQETLTDSKEGSLILYGNIYVEFCKLIN